MPRGAREDRQETREEGGRKRRIPLGGGELKLDAPERKGYVRRFVNDEPGRIEKFEDVGYARVELAGGGVEKRFVGRNEDGSPKHAILMEQKIEHYEEDQAIKQAQVDEIDEALGQTLQTPHGPRNVQGEFYTPKGGGVRRDVES